MTSTDDLTNFDMEEFIEGNHKNALCLLKRLRDENYWQHFVNISNCYDDLIRLKEEGIPSSHLKMAWLHFLSGCSTNLRRGIYNVLWGGLTDSSIYVRRTIECVRYSVYLRENVDVANLWFSPTGKVQFEKGYKKWRDKGGGDLIEQEMPNSKRYFEHASNYGPHSNAQLFSQQHMVSIEKDVMKFWAVNHELSPDVRGSHSFLSAFFWHLRVHSLAVDWWMQKSGFIKHMNEMQRAYWRDCRSAREKDDEVVKKIIANGPLGKELPGI
jgi:hypothetical protein